MSYWKDSNDYLIELKDCKILEIECDNDFSSGYCDTCDIGSSYVNCVRFLTNDDEFDVEFVGDFDYLISEAKLIRTLLFNTDRFKEMTFEEFKQFMQNVSNFVGDKECEFLELIRS